MSLALEVTDLHISYLRPGGEVRAVRGLSLTVRQGEVFGIAGESGSGKTTLALAALRLLRPPAAVLRGRVMVDGVDVLALDEAELRRMRWKRVALVPQGSMHALNPVLRVEQQIADAIVAHEGPQPPRLMTARIEALLESVRLPPATRRRYPHELSGGMRQRVCIAMAIALRPGLLFADEPTSALDVVAQRSVAEALLDARERVGAALVLIGHDLGLHAQLVDRLAVMRSGRIVELGPVREVFKAPRHRYTQRLLAAVPVPGRAPARPESFPAEGCPLGPRCDGGPTHEVGIGHVIACERAEAAA